MSSHGMADANTAAPLWFGLQQQVIPDRANANVAFGNITFRSSVAHGNAAVGLFGVSKTEAANTLGPKSALAHSGWVARTAGMGALSGVTIAVAGSGYANAAFLTFAGGGTANTVANAQIFVNGAGAITSVVVNNPGMYSSAPTATAPTGTGATLTPVVGGRAGRVQYETLVTSKNITGDAAVTDNTTFPGA